MSRNSRGFSLVETLVVVGVVSVLAALAGMGIVYGTRRARLQNALFEISAMAATAQMRALSTSRAHHLVFYENTAKTRFGVYLLDDGTTNWAGVTLNEDSAVTASGLGSVWAAGTITDALRMGSDSSIKLKRDAAWFNGEWPSHKLPAPFATVPIPTGTDADLRGACTFCISVSGGRIGVIRFGSDGTVSPATGANSSGGSIAFDVADDLGEASRPRLIAISSPSGAIRIFP